MADMIDTLPLFHKVAGTRVVVIGEGAMGEAKRRLVERAGGIPCDETEAHHARIAFVALEDETAATAAARRLSQKGLLVNVADRPHLCDFTTPSLLDRNPLLIAIGTGGASAGLAKHVRLRLEAILPQSIGPLARALATGRDRLRAILPDGDDRRRAVDAALREGGPLDPMREGSETHVEAWLGNPRADAQPETQTITLTSGDPEDLTVRQARWLGEADVIMHEADMPAAILARARADAERISLEADQEPPVVGESGLTVILRRAR